MSDSGEPFAKQPPDADETLAKAAERILTDISPEDMAAIQKYIASRATESTGDGPQGEPNGYRRNQCSSETPVPTKTNHGHLLG